ncbi:hypothetical protein WA026_003637 [Henosepilachna vigintioctopunctata]|uniref:Uncharacterized protein n=1 Tax=Henosepilachna vigintioctopunctata TaxID=420089 RepID=A0AAW1UDT4_9CUCU
MLSHKASPTVTRTLPPRLRKFENEICNPQKFNVSSSTCLPYTQVSSGYHREEQYPTTLALLRPSSKQEKRQFVARQSISVVVVIAKAPPRPRT